MRRFDSDYREEVTLRGGSHARLRLVRPDDKPLFEGGFARMSRQSRYLRFFAGKDRLTANELRYLTELDGETHVAIGAIGALADGTEGGLGVARFVRLAEEPEVAELAVAVIDSVQREGLGRILCTRIVEAARERGVTRIRGEVLASNSPALTMVRDLVPSAELRNDGDALVIDFPIPEAAAEGGSLIAQLLALAAKGMLMARRALDRLG